MEARKSNGASPPRSAVGPGRRRRLKDGRLALALDVFCALFACWIVYQAVFLTIDALSLSVFFVCGVLVILFLTVGASATSDPDWPTLPDFILSGMAAATAVFFATQVDELSTRISLFSELSNVQLAFGVLVTLLVLEATRRSVGYGLLAVILLTVMYNLFGHQLDGFLRHGTITLNHFIDISVYTINGIFGAPVRVAATYAFIFVLFGTLLEKAGGGDFFYGAAAYLTGNQPGGPAKIAVISSGLFGTISGSPTSDVITTGSITIPAMKRTGYPPELAGAIEVAASTGGSLLPPVMGAAAFIMAEYTTASYWEIASAAVIPALLFYSAVMMQVHLRTQRLGMTAPAQPDTGLRSTSLAQGYVYLIPATVLVWMLADGYTPILAGLVGGATIIVTSFLPGARNLGPKQLYEVLVSTVYRMVGVSAACAGAGLVIGGITMTGLAQKFAHVVMLFGEQQMLLALVIGALVSIVLGMGMPTSSAYILAAVLVAPVLVGELALPEISAHMFLFYFAVLSAMTPPVAVAAYAASAIAEANPITIGMKAVKLSVAAILIPFGFVANPALLLQGSLLEIAGASLVCLLAIMLMAFAAEGYLKRNLRKFERLAFAIASIATIGLLTLI
jgi:TRAP transporter 4TM/12TM fusion protein